MPAFGFDPKEAEKIVSEVQELNRRVYVEVLADWLPNGTMIPLSFTWENGTEYKIDKVLAVQKGHSLKAFAPGFRYRCQTGKRIFFLHYDGERWYVEVKQL